MLLDQFPLNMKFAVLMYSKKQGESGALRNMRIPEESLLYNE